MADNGAALAVVSDEARELTPSFKVTSGTKGTTTTFTSRTGRTTVSSITKGLSSFTRLFSKK